MIISNATHGDTEKTATRAEECTGVSELLVNCALTPPVAVLFPTKRFMINSTSEKDGSRIWTRREENKHGRRLGTRDKGGLTCLRCLRDDFAYGQRYYAFPGLVCWGNGTRISLLANSCHEISRSSTCRVASTPGTSPGGWTILRGNWELRSRLQLVAKWNRVSTCIKGDNVTIATT